MDFLRTCTTNIHVVENVGQVGYTLFRPRDHGHSTAALWSRLQTIMADLRTENVLCAAVGLRLYVFAQATEPSGTLHDDWNVAENGVIGTQSALEPKATIFLRSVFETAIELSLAAKMARDPAIVHIGPWTWLYRAGGSMELDHPDSTVITLHIRTTSTDRLFLISDVIPASFESMDKIHEQSDTALVLAPFGQSARVHSAWSERDLMEGEAWKAKVAHLLQAQLISLPDDVEWLAVELADDSTKACVWPSHLCFTSSNHDELFASTLGADSDWRRWFISTEEGAIFRNPLAMTEEWYRAAADRERAIALTLASAPIEAHTTGAVQAARSLDVPAGETEPAASPLALHRNADHSSAMAGIYPTPPDGFAGGQSGAHHGVATPLVSQLQHVNAITSTSPAHDIASKLSADAQSSPHDDSGDLVMAQEDLFGDVGEIGFGDAEIDDVDFSFFDEPDDGFAEQAQQEDLGVSLESTQDLMRLTGESQSANSNVHADNAVQPEVPPVAATPHSDPADVVNVVQSDANIETDSGVDSSFQVAACPSARQRRPLSPFGIRERLLPPPVPASHSQAQTESMVSGTNRRNSSFTPLAFREILGKTSKYTAAMDEKPHPQPEGSPTAVNCKVAPAFKKLEDEDETSDSSDSEEELYESSHHAVNETNLPPSLPWETRKRKRPYEEEPTYVAFDKHNTPWLSETHAEIPSDSGIDDQLVEILQQYTSVDDDASFMLRLNTPKQELDGLAHETAMQAGSLETTFLPLPSVSRMHELSKADLVCVAQLVSEQCATITSSASTTLLHGIREDVSIVDIIAKHVRGRLLTAVREILSEIGLCDLADLALSKETLSRQAVKPTHGQPRPPQRLESMQTGPDVFLLPSPHLKLRRGLDSWELLPACIPFWEPLNLGPAAGPKNVRAFCVFPFNEDLQRLVDQFLGDMSTAYENCKLGTHVHVRKVSELEQDNFEDGMAPVELGEDASLEAALKAYGSTCSDLGKTLAIIAHKEAGDRAIVVYILNPFAGRSARQHMCACFWTLFQAYRANMPTKPRDQGGSDIVLQLLPISMVASCDLFVPLDAAKMSALAREVYDRCPPASALQLSDVSAPLPILAAPTVELASTAPKRLGFQLASEAPSDLLFEGSILHLAYAFSADGKWLTASWIDSTGKYQSSSSFALMGRTFGEVANDVWEHTRTILAARQVLWRVFIVAPDATVDAAVLHCWRMLAAKPRPQPVCVTMLSVQTKPLLQLLTPHVASEQLNSGAADTGVLTPASTPQGGVFTSSPDVAGHAGAAPLTPAASESAVSLPTDSAVDVESQLVDLSDETWGVMLSAKLSGMESAANMAHGLLVKRGGAAYGETEHGETAERLPTLGVSLHWTIQVKNQGSVDEGSAKQGELTLREVLRMYRGLALLTKARGLHSEVGSFAPLHVVLAAAGAAGLEGLVPDDEDSPMSDAQQ